MNHKISIIVPIYNREHQIERCLHSLLEQTYPNLEIIAVNDGSTDHTQQRLETFAKQYKERLIVVETVNQGVSMARNEGLKRATGSYIGFVDSDDYVAKDMYEKLMEKAIHGDFDIVGCQTLALYPNKEMVIDSHLEDGQAVKKLLIDAYAVLWNKLYRADILKGLTFKKDVWYEDVLFLYQVYPRVNRVGRIEDIGYYYVQNEGSITYTYNELLYQLLENLDDMLQYYKDQGLYDLYKDELIYTYVRYSYGTFIKRLAKSKDKEQFQIGCKQVIQKVNKVFPEYRHNIYLKKPQGKSIYLRYFNQWIAQLVYLKEKNKMN